MPALPHEGLPSWAQPKLFLPGGQPVYNPLTAFAKPEADPYVNRPTGGPAFGPNALAGVENLLRSGVMMGALPTAGILSYMNEQALAAKQKGLMAPSPPMDFRPLGQAGAEISDYLLQRYARPPYEAATGQISPQQLGQKIVEGANKAPVESFLDLAGPKIAKETARLGFKGYVKGRVAAGKPLPKIPSWFRDRPVPKWIENLRESASSLLEKHVKEALHTVNIERLRTFMAGRAELDKVWSALQPQEKQAMHGIATMSDAEALKLYGESPRVRNFVIVARKYADEIAKIIGVGDVVHDKRVYGVVYLSELYMENKRKVAQLAAEYPYASRERQVVIKKQIEQLRKPVTMSELDNPQHRKGYLAVKERFVKSGIKEPVYVAMLQRNTADKIISNSMEQMLGGIRRQD